MDITIIIGVVIPLIMLGAFLWMNRTYKEKLADVADELKFFKKEKEYYNEAMIVFSKDYKVLFANQSAKNLFSLNKEYKEFALGIDVQLQIASDPVIDFFEAIEKKSSSTEENFYFKDTIFITNKEKKKANIYIDKSTWNIDNTFTCVIDIASSTESVMSNKDGKVDFLTGLPSQFSSLSEINSLVMESQKKSESFALFLLGIDHYDDIQATLGNNYTNQILKKITNYFIENPDLNRKIYRMDCDKFLLVIKNIDADESARKEARKLIFDIGDYYKGENNTRITVSLGIVRYPAHGENATKLINHVYFALNKAQKASESNIEFFNAETQVLHKDEVKMNKEIIKGLQNGEFLLHYQPVFNLKNEVIIGAEALIRWNHPTQGIITPEKFLEVSEKTGLIVDIGEYAFREAMKQRKKWDEHGFENLKITLNLSLREMKVDQLVKKLDRLFEEYAVDPLDFNLDISEEDAMTNIEKTVVDFKLFKDLGLSLSLDNVGAEYSSLKYLQSLPISTLKIDRSLIFDLASNLDHQMAVKSIIQLAHTLGYEVVAEGVETSRESKILSGLKCDHAQGYLYSRPLPVFEFQALLR